MQQCAYRQAHYERIAEYNKQCVRTLKHDVEPLSQFDLCLSRYYNYVNPDCSNTNLIDFRDLSQYVDAGFSHFKLIGREWPVNQVMENLKKYVERGWAQHLAGGNYEY